MSRKRSNSSEQRRMNMNTTTGCKQRPGPGVVPALGSVVQSSEPAQPASDPCGGTKIHPSGVLINRNRNLRHEIGGLTSRTTGDLHTEPGRQNLLQGSSFTEPSHGINKRVESGSYTRRQSQWLQVDSHSISTRSINEHRPGVRIRKQRFKKERRRRANPSGFLFGLAGH
jgi:hypothetical protein